MFCIQLVLKKVILILIILFSLSKIQNYMSVSSLYQKLIKINNQKLSKLFSKWFGRSVYWNKYKTKSENKNATNEYRYFLESNFVTINSLFLSIYLSRDNHVKRLKTRRCYLSINKQSYSQWKIFLWLSHWCRYKTIQTNRKLTTGKSEDQKSL